MAYVYRGTKRDAHIPLPARTREQAKKVAACGTPAGYQAHRRFDEAVCAACSEAYSADQKFRREARKAVLAA